MTAETIAKALGGRKAGGGWSARCPAHVDGTPSLSISDAYDGKVLVHCHAGCDQARVISALRSRGLWTESRRRGFTRSATRKSAPHHDDGKRTEVALEPPRVCRRLFSLSHAAIAGSSRVA